MQLKALLIFLLYCTTMQAQQPRLTITTSHTGTILSAEFSTDGKKLVTTSQDRYIKLWDVQSGKMLKETKMEACFPEYACFSSDNKKILIAANSKLIDASSRLSVLTSYDPKKAEGYLYSWDIYSGEKKQVMKLSNYEGTVYMELSSIGQRLLLLSATTQAIILADPLVGKVISTSQKITPLAGILTDQNNNVIMDYMAGVYTNTHFSPDGKMFISSLGRNLKIWNAENGALIKEIKTNGAYLSLTQFDNSGKKIIIGYTGGNNLIAFETRSIETGKLLDTLTIRGSDALNMQISKDWKYVVGEKSAWTYNAVENKRTKIMFPEDIKSAKSKFSPDNKKFILFSKNKLLLYDFQNNQYNTSLSGNITPAEKLILSQDGNKLLVSSAENSGVVIELLTGRILLTIPANPDGEDPRFTNDSRYIITTSKKGTATYELATGQLVLERKLSGTAIPAIARTNTIRPKFGDSGWMEIWDADGKNMISEIKVPFSFSKAEFGNNQNTVIAAQNAAHMGTGFISYQSIYVYDLQKKEVRYKVDSVSEQFYLSPDKNRLIMTKGNPDNKTNSIIGLDLVTGKKITYAANIKLRMAAYQLYANANFSADGQKVALTNAANQVLLYDAINGKLLFEFKDPEITKNFRWANDDIKDFSTNGNFIKFYSKLRQDDFFEKVREKISVYNIQTGQLALTLTGSEGLINSISISADGKIIAGPSENAAAAIIDAATGKQYPLEQIESTIQSSLFSRDNSLAYCLSGNIIRVYQSATGKLLRNFYCFNANDNITLLPGGYYAGSKKALQSMYYVTNNLGIITFEQQDIKYNRPDFVLQNLGSRDTSLINAYKKAYYKRAKKLDLDTSALNAAFNIPEASIINREQINYEQTTNKLVLTIKTKDSLQLSRFNIWVNEVPLYGQRGINLRNRNRNSFDTTITIKLSDGENTIETSVSNTRGTESYREPLLVKYTPVTTQKAKLYFVGIGIDKFVDNRYNLNYSAKDIRDMAGKLKIKYSADIIIDTLLNEQVNLKNILSLKQKLLTSGENDKVIIAYSGHGMLDNNFDYFLSTYNVNFGNPTQNGLPYEELENLLDSIPARKKLLLIDACHSGEVDKEELQKITASPDSLIKGLKPVGLKKDNQVGLKNSFELMKELFVDVGRSTGATIISASGGTQFARERKDLQNGVFTFSILEAMNQNATLKISELKTIVGQRVQELTKGLQQPTSRNETIAVDWTIW